MKAFKIFIVLLFIGSMASAQTTWRAVYQFKRIQSEESKKKEDSIIKQKPELAGIYKQLRESFSNITYYLDFNKKASVFREEEKLNDKKFASGGMVIKIVANEDVLYKNIAKNQYVKTSGAFDGKYKIVDKTPEYNWKVTKETKQIGNYLVIKAEGSKEIEDRKGKKKTVTVIAWFTPQIPVGTGPELFGGLPGLILEVRMDNELFLAKEVIINPKKHQKIEEPSKGVAISQTKFEEKEKAYIKKMKKMYKNNRSNKGSNTQTFTF